MGCVVYLPSKGFVWFLQLTGLLLDCRRIVVPDREFMKRTYYLILPSSSSCPSTLFVFLLLGFRTGPLFMDYFSKKSSLRSLGLNFQLVQLEKSETEESSFFTLFIYSDLILIVKSSTNMS